MLTGRAAAHRPAAGRAAALGRLAAGHRPDLQLHGRASSTRTTRWRWPRRSARWSASARRCCGGAGATWSARPRCWRRRSRLTALVVASSCSAAAPTSCRGCACWSCWSPASGASRCCCWPALAGCPAGRPRCVAAAALVAGAGRPGGVRRADRGDRRTPARSRRAGPAVAGGRSAAVPAAARRRRSPAAARAAAVPGGGPGGTAAAARRPPGGTPAQPGGTGQARRARRRPVAGGGGVGGLLNASTPSAELSRAAAGRRRPLHLGGGGGRLQQRRRLPAGHREPVMAIGGFNGSDPSPTLAQFQQYVADGKIHYFIGGGGFGGGRRQPGGSDQQRDRAAWVAGRPSPRTTVDGVTRLRPHRGGVAVTALRQTRRPDATRPGDAAAHHRSLDVVIPVYNEEARPRGVACARLHEHLRDAARTRSGSPSPTTPAPTAPRLVARRLADDATPTCAVRPPGREGPRPGAQAGVDARPTRAGARLHGRRPVHRPRRAAAAGRAADLAATPTWPSAPGWPAARGSCAAPSGSSSRAATTCCCAARCAARFSDAQCGFKAIRARRGRASCCRWSRTPAGSSTPSCWCWPSGPGCASTRCRSTGSTTRTAGSTSSPPRWTTCAGIVRLGRALLHRRAARWPSCSRAGSAAGRRCRPPACRPGCPGQLLPLRARSGWPARSPTCCSTWLLRAGARPRSWRTCSRCWSPRSPTRPRTGGSPSASRGRRHAARHQAAGPAASSPSGWR